MLSSFMTFCYCFLFVLMTSSFFWLLLLFLFLTLFLFVAVAAAAVLFGANSNNNNNKDKSNNKNNCYVIWNLCTASWVHCLFELPCMTNMKGVFLLHNYQVSSCASSCPQGIQQSVCLNWLVFKHFIITLWLTSPSNVHCVLFHTFCSFAFVKLPVKKRKGKEENNKKELPTRSFSVTKLAGGEERRATATIMLTCVCHRGPTDLRGMTTLHPNPLNTTKWVALWMSGSVLGGHATQSSKNFKSLLVFIVGYRLAIAIAILGAEALSRFLYLQSRLYASWAA